MSLYLIFSNYVKDFFFFFCILQEKQETQAGCILAQKGGKMEKRLNTAPARALRLLNGISISSKQCIK